MKWLVYAALAASVSGVTALREARDRQDRAALEKLAAEEGAAAKAKPNDAAAQYQLATAHSYVAEVAIEQHDKQHAFAAAQSGIEAAERAVQLNPNSAEYHRTLGALCGQAISSAGFAGLRHGKCALDEVDRAIHLDPTSSDAYLSHGVGMFYLPAAFGGGVDQAIKDFRKAIDLNPKSDDAWLWLGIALRKTNQPAEAHKAIEKSLELNPARLWAQQQLAKTPAK